MSSAPASPGTLLIRTPGLGQSEKLAWEYAFTFRGRLCSLAQEKFGLRLYLQQHKGERC